MVIQDNWDFNLSRLGTIGGGLGNYLYTWISGVYHSEPMVLGKNATMLAQPEKWVHNAGSAI